MASVSSNDNFIDSRDVEMEADQYQSDIDDKQEEINDTTEELDEAREIDDDEAIADLDGKLANLQDELTDLKEESESILELHEECENYARGGSLINESYFTEYCEEFAYDCGEISRDSSMSQYVDWDRYAEDSKMDYTTITFEGTDFYVQG